MTIAVVDRINWLGPDDVLIDKDRVVPNLKMYLELHKASTENS